MILLRLLLLWLAFNAAFLLWMWGAYGLARWRDGR